MEPRSQAPGLGQRVPPGWEHPPARRQIPQQPLGNGDSGTGDRSLFSLLLVGSVYSPSRLGLAAPWPLWPTGQGLQAGSHFQTLLHQQGWDGPGSGAAGGAGGAGRGWQGLAGGGPRPFRVPRGFGRREVLSTLAHLNPFLLPLSPGMHFEGVTGTGVVAVGWIVPGK